MLSSAEIPAPVAQFARFDTGSLLRSPGDRDPGQLFSNETYSLGRLINTSIEKRASELELLIRQALVDPKTTILIPADKDGKYDKGHPLALESEYHGHRVVVYVGQRDIDPEKMKDLWKRRGETSYRQVQRYPLESRRESPARDYVFHAKAVDLLKNPYPAMATGGYEAVVYWNNIPDSRGSNMPELRHGPNRVIERLYFSPVAAGDKPPNNLLERGHSWEMHIEQEDGWQNIKLGLPYDENRHGPIHFDMESSSGKGKSERRAKIWLGGNPNNLVVQMQLRDGDVQISGSNTITDLAEDPDGPKTGWILSHYPPTAAEARLLAEHGITRGENTVPPVAKLLASVESGLRLMQIGLQLKSSVPTEPSFSVRLPRKQEIEDPRQSREWILVRALNLNVKVPHLLDVLRVKKGEIGELCGISEEDVLGIINRTTSLEEIDPDSVLAVIKRSRPNIKDSGQTEKVNVQVVASRLKLALSVLRLGSDEGKFDEYVALMRLARIDQDILPVLTVTNPSRVEEFKAIINRGNNK